MKKVMSLAAITALSLIFNGCSSKEVMIEKSPPSKYVKLGQVEDTGSGSLGLLGTAYYAVPMGLNSRTERAYNNALSKKNDATQLINVTYQEDWSWWVLGTNRTVTIKGEAIKEVSK
jgi:PBP1b-binding outer membrane lipoprotein LpoB